MKTIFISYNQTLTEPIQTILSKLRIKGYTQWTEVYGAGSEGGEPHHGTHTWPAKNTVILTVVEDQKVEPVLEALRELDSRTEQQGLRAFVWNVEAQL